MPVTAKKEHLDEKRSLIPKFILIFRIIIPKVMMNFGILYIFAKRLTMQNMITRLLQNTIESRMFTGKAIIVIGARQVGKSTLMKMIVEKQDSRNA